VERETTGRGRERSGTSGTLGRKTHFVLWLSSLIGEVPSYGKLGGIGATEGATAWGKKGAEASCEFQLRRTGRTIPQLGEKDTSSMKAVSPFPFGGEKKKTQYGRKNLVFRMGKMFNARKVITKVAEGGLNKKERGPGIASLGKGLKRSKKGIYLNVNLMRRSCRVHKVITG